MNKILNLFTKTVRYTGATDNLTISDKEKLWNFNEVASGDDLVFEERKPKFHSVRNQASSYSCVANTIAKMVEIIDENNIEQYSAMEVYRARVNYPGAGCIGDDVLKRTCEMGIARESKIPSQNLTEAQMNAYPYPTQKYTDKPLNFLAVNPNFYTVARAIKDNKCAMIWVRCRGDNYKLVPTAGVDSDAFRHSITAVDYIKKDGVEYIIVEDSWGSFSSYPRSLTGIESILKDGQRAFTKEFFDKHVFYARVLVGFSYETEVRIDTNYVFKNTMEFMYRNNDVKELQDRLKKEGLFPSNLPSTGYYGNITAQAVLAYQIKNNVAPLNELNLLKGKRVGAKTILALNR